eukprot:CAMPEP_0117673924 /NCGR_PEP_ID=MMETSP0804-20121206/14751_1 /TAXON_ID=1074897 /ORGANISM="Tetraselmis astigmatica, Strain CCMP880" /LENGTH=175 /DNA_ID=CAMNT_0005482733 /DNA_START=1063 /DNA_END=1587 /DNA_ORIENTATION=+
MLLVSFYQHFTAPQRFCENDAGVASPPPFGVVHVDNHPCTWGVALVPARAHAAVLLQEAAAAEDPRRGVGVECEAAVLEGKLALKVVLLGVWHARVLHHPLHCLPGHKALIALTLKALAVVSQELQTVVLHIPIFLVPLPIGRTGGDLCSTEPFDAQPMPSRTQPRQRAQEPIRS